MKRVLLTAGAGGLVATALASSGAPAGASQDDNPYSPAAGHTYRHGAIPSVGQLKKMQAWQASQPGSATGPETLSYGGGAVGVTEGAPRVYLVFWGSQWGPSSTDSGGSVTFPSTDTAGAAPYLQKMFQGLGTGGELWSGTMTQYCDGSTVATGATACPAGATHVGYPTGGALAGVWYDSSSAEPSAATGNQLAKEAIAAASHFGNTTAASNRDVQYDIVSAPGLDPDGYKAGGFCAWHDWSGDSGLSGGAASSPYGPIAFTTMPYLLDVGASCGENFVNSGSAGTLDGFSIVNGHEFAETVTDQEPGYGWYNRQASSSYGGEENADECAWLSSGSGAAADVAMGDGTFAMQSTWSNDTNSCAISHPVVTASSGAHTVTVTNPGNQSTPRYTSVNLSMHATDSASGSALIWSASGLPSGLRINTTTGAITGTTNSTIRTYSVTVKAADSTGAGGTASFSWSVHR